MFDAGSSSSDFNQSCGINAWMNSIRSLFFRHNDMKLFEDKHLTVSNEIDLANGLRLTTSIKYGQISTLKNHSDYSFFYGNQRNYTDNEHSNDFALPSQPTSAKSFEVSAGLTYTPEYYYKIENHRKHMIRSKFPTFELNYRTGLKGILGSTSSYQFFSGGLHQQIETEGGSSIQYALEGGLMFQVTDIPYSQYHHFNTQPIPVQFGIFDKSFQLLPYYQFSTIKNYLEGHLKYQTDLLLVKHIPGIANRMWNENVYLNYLTTPLLKNYTEIGYGIGQIMLMGEIGVFCSFENFKYQASGIRININLN